MGTWSLRDTQYDFKMVFFMVLQGLYYNPQGSHEPDILAIKGSLNIGISCASTHPQGTGSLLRSRPSVVGRLRSLTRGSPNPTSPKPKPCS